MQYTVDVTHTPEVAMHRRRGLYTPVLGTPVDSIIHANGTLIVEGRISNLVDECPYNGNLLSGLVAVTCLIRSADSYPGGPGILDKPGANPIGIDHNGKGGNGKPGSSGPQLPQVPRIPRPVTKPTPGEGGPKRYVEEVYKEFPTIPGGPDGDSVPGGRGMPWGENGN